LYEYGDEQVKIRKRRRNNKEFFIENRYVNRKLEKEGGGNSVLRAPVGTTKHNLVLN
jgi:hypothetical protein